MTSTISMKLIGLSLCVLLSLNVHLKPGVYILRVLSPLGRASTLRLVVGD